MTLEQLRKLGFESIFHLETCLNKAFANAHTDWERIFTQRLLEDYLQKGVNIRFNKRTANLILNMSGEYNDN